MAASTNTPVATGLEDPARGLGAGTSRRPESLAHPRNVGEQGRLCPDVSTSDSDSVVPSVAFAPTACLFCPQLSFNFDANLIHMQKGHGLFIPSSIDDGELCLAVDKKTLVEYMHLVIFGYHECLFCGTQRADEWAVRQHMMGRGHCRIDLAGVDSEWRDFYGSDNLSDSEDEDEEGLEDESEASLSGRHQVYTGAILRLSSGKVIMNRTAPAPRILHHKPLAGGKSRQNRHGIEHVILDDSISTDEQLSTCTSSPNAAAADLSSTGDATSRTSSSTTPSSLQTMARADRRRLLMANRSALSVAVAQMSTRDRAALAHLSPTERRATILGQFKHQERVQTGERKYWSKFERRQDRPAEGGKVYIGGG